MMRMFFMAAAFALALTAATRADAAPAGEVLAMGGQCFRVTGSERAALKIGDPVSVGDSVEVPQGAKLKLRMADGTILAAASGSRLTIENYALGGATKRDAKLELASGLVRAVVAAVGEPQKFEVDTATGVAAVRSTDWFIEAKGDATQVGVLEGVVTLQSVATHDEVRIPARWGARVVGDHDPVPPRVWMSSEFDDVISRTDVP